jgi:putative FmdB family regulatory protein
MPLFEYECRKCNLSFEAYKRPHEDAAAEKCPTCGEKARKVEISLVGSAGAGSPSIAGAGKCGGGSSRSPFR